MRCFPWKRPRPRPAPTADLLAAALTALPCRVELITAEGYVVFSNRPGHPRPTVPPGTVIRLGDGISMSCWGACAGGSTIPLDDVPALAFRVTYPSESSSVAPPYEINVNTRWGDFFGGSGDPLLLWMKAVHPDDKDRVMETWRHARDTHSAFSVEYRVARSAEDAITWLRMTANPVMTDRGSVAGFIGIQEVITERRETEERLLEERRRLETVLDQLPTGAVIAKAPSGDLTLFNRRFCEIWGISRAAVDSLTGAQYLSQLKRFRPDGAELAPREAPVARALLGEHVMGEEMLIETVTGSRRLLMMFAAPILGRAGDIIAAVAIAEDITGVKEKEAQRLQLLADAKATAVKTQLMANVSHELRTPIHGILGLTELLRDSLSPASTATVSKVAAAEPPAASGLEEIALSTQLEYCSAIRGCAQHLQALVCNVLDYTKLDAGKMQLEQLPLLLSELAGEVFAFMRSSANDDGVALTLSVDPEIPRVLGDALRVKQVLINLVGNAVKFSKGAPGGGITIIRVTLEQGADSALFACCDKQARHTATVPPADAASVGSPPRIGRDVATAAPSDVSAVADGVIRVRIEVEDNGPGVPQDVQARLFRPFEQADTSTTRRFGGTGLGLSIVRGIVQLMGGWTDVTSPNARGGATFICSVPFQVEQSVYTRSDSSRAVESQHHTGDLGADSSHDWARLVVNPAQSVSLRGRRILVVEDSRLNRIIAERFLSAQGVHVDLAVDGKAGLDAVNNAPAPYDLVFMDCQMPVMDGFTATRAIRKLRDPARARVPIIALSASTLPEDVGECLDAGMDAHLPKPVSSTALVACVAQWVESGGAQK